jgi:hypothetical protein
MSLLSFFFAFPDSSSFFKASTIVCYCVASAVFSFLLFFSVALMLAMPLKDSIVVSFSVGRAFPTNEVDRRTLTNTTTAHEMPRSRLS